MKLLPYFVILVSFSVQAEVVTDGSLGAVQSFSGQFEIGQRLGTTVGNNLFHSFQQFTLQKGESATFTGDAVLQNVISRVTGGNPSLINGLLRSTISQANFYFINPAGVAFGANAQVDVPAAFHVSTADNLKFADGKSFAASLAASSVLSVAEPASFGFLGKQVADIQIQGSQLSFKEGSQASFSAGNIVMDDGILKIAAGEMQLYGVGNKPIDISFAKPTTEVLAGNLKLTNTPITVSGNGKGQLWLRAGEVNLSNNSNLYLGNQSNLDTETGIDLISHITVLDNSAFMVEALKAGHVGNINLQTEQLFISNGGGIFNISNDLGNAGNININANQISIDGKGNGAFISTNTINKTLPNAGNAGNIAIHGNNLDILNGGQINSGSSGTGNGGHINLDVNHIVLDGQESTAGILSNAYNTEFPNMGNAGNVTIQGDSLILKNSDIVTSTFGVGNAGNININVGQITVEGNGNLTIINSDALNRTLANAGNAGNVNLKGNSLKITNGGQISSNTWGSSNAGSINLEFGEIVLDAQGSLAEVITDTYGTGQGGMINIKGNHLNIINGGSISSSSWQNGNAGSIDINVAKISIDGQGNLASITSSTNNKTLTNAGNAGAIAIKSDNLTVLNNGLIRTNTLGIGNAGKINIDASHIIVDGQENIATIESSTNNKILTNAGNAGVLNVKANTVSVLNNSLINTSTLGTGNAGSINIDAGQVIVNGAAIASDTYNANLINAGNAGAVAIRGNVLNIFNGGSIGSSTSGAGHAGNVDINMSQIVMNGQGIPSGITSDTTNKILANAGNAGIVTVKANTLSILNNSGISSSTFGTGQAKNIDIDATQILIDGQKDIAWISSDTYGKGNAGTINVKGSDLNILNGGQISSGTWRGTGRAGTVSVNAAMVTVDNALIHAAALADSGGQTGDVNVTATKFIDLRNKGLISIENQATVANSSALTPTILTVTSPVINLKDSEITTTSFGNANASNIAINFTDKLLLDPSYITTTANTGNGGTIDINGGKVIYLQDSGFKTSVSGANSNGGNINVKADVLVMNTGVIQANAVGGSGGDINLKLQALIPSYNSLIKGGTKVIWQPFIAGFNVIQAASENGVSGTLTITAPQFDISGSTSGLDSSGLALPRIERDACSGTIEQTSSLAPASKGGLPIHEAETGFIPAIQKTITSSTPVSPLMLKGSASDCTN